MDRDTPPPPNACQRCEKLEPSSSGLLLPLGAARSGGGAARPAHSRSGAAGGGGLRRGGRARVGRHVAAGGVVPLVAGSGVQRLWQEHVLCGAQQQRGEAERVVLCARVERRAELFAARLACKEVQRRRQHEPPDALRRGRLDGVAPRGVLLEQPPPALGRVRRCSVERRVRRRPPPRPAHHRAPDHDAAQPPVRGRVGAGEQDRSRRVEVLYAAVEREGEVRQRRSQPLDHAVVQRGDLPVLRGGEAAEHRLPRVHRKVGDAASLGDGGDKARELLEQLVLVGADRLGRRADDPDAALD
mmetsp:Transcript_1756/g.5546  ORF Transcript_1756/g.5546 Transcript_1756/m.5546 type:complete len:300 (-) Transcript_1756:530-1429(-)